MAEFTKVGQYFPTQRLSYNQKKANQFQWAKDCLNALDSLTSTQTWGEDDKKRMKVNYDLYNGIFDINDFQYVVKPYGQEMGELPAKLDNYDIISGKINVLLGEELSRPFNFSVHTTNREAINEKLQQKEKLIEQYITSLVQKTLAEQGLNQQQIEESLTPEQIQEYMMSYKDTREVMAQQFLNYLLPKEKVKEKFYKGWKHALIAGVEVYWVGIVNGEPVLRPINPLFFYYDKDPDIEYIQDGNWAGYEMFLDRGTVIDLYGQYMTLTEMEEIDSGYVNYGSHGGPGTHKGNYINYGEYKDPFFSNGYLVDENLDFIDHPANKIRVVHFEWVSLRKLGILTYIDKDNIIQKMIVDEAYKFNEENGDIDIQWQWYKEIWEGTKIGNNIFVNMRPKQNQHRDIDNLSNCELGYKGINYCNTNADSVSLIDRMKPYQYLYNIIMFRLEKELAGDRGKKFLMDINQIPDSLGIDTNKWLYYFDALDIILINPHEEGQTGRPNNFNQFSEINLSTAENIDRKISLLQYLELRCGQAVGVSPQRESMVDSNDLVGTTQQAIVQSTYITEPWFYMHNTLKGHILRSLIECAQQAYKDREKVAQYILNDLTTAYLKLDPEVFNSASYGVYVTDTGKEKLVFETMKQLTQAMVQQQSLDISTMVKALEAASTAELADILEKGEKKRQEIQQQQAQAEQQAAAQIEQQRAEIEAKKIEILQENNIRDNETRIAVAEIQSFSRQIDQDINDNNVPDQLEIEKLRVKEKELSSKERMEKEKMRFEEQENEKDRELKRTEIRNRPKPKK